MDRQDRAFADATVALPIACELAGRDAADIRRYVESVLGWQVVDTATASLIPPEIRLVDAASGTTGSAVPSVLLVSDADDPAAVAAQCLATRPLAVLRWPDARNELHDVIAGVLHGAVPQTSTATTVMRVGGGSGGVGTTTVALGLAGISGWRGKTTVAVLRTDEFVPETRKIDPTACMSPDLYARATPIAGCPMARAVVVDTDAEIVPSHASEISLVVVDRGVSVDVDVLVIRPDRAGLCALERSATGTVVVVGQGPVPKRVLDSAAAGRQVHPLAWSARVQRTGFHQRVPAGLPGAWLRQLGNCVSGV